MIYYQALGEALAMARRTGLDAERLMDMIADSSGGSEHDEGSAARSVAKTAERRGNAGHVRHRGLHQGLGTRCRPKGKARKLSLPLVQMTLACMEESASSGPGRPRKPRCIRSIGPRR